MKNKIIGNAEIQGAILNGDLILIRANEMYLSSVAGSNDEKTNKNKNIPNKTTEGGNEKNLDELYFQSINNLLIFGGAEF